MRQPLKTMRSSISCIDDRMDELEEIRRRKLEQMKAAAQAPKPPEVIVYSTPDCPYCTMAKEFFSGKGIKFVEYDVSKDKEKAREMVMKTQQGGVPVIQIDGRLIIGFDRRLIEETLKKKPLMRKEDVINNLVFDPFEK
jgi:glutaredoxin 3